MFTTLFSFSLSLAVIRFVLAQSDFAINTPSLVQCQSAQINWTDTGHPPYDLLVVPADDECGNAIEDLGNQTSTSMTWTVNIASGTRVVLSLLDATGNEAWSQNITVGASSDTSCLASHSSVPGGGSGSSTGASPSPSFVPVGAAGSGLVPVSGALPTRHLSAATALGSIVLAAVAFIF